MKFKKLWLFWWIDNAIVAALWRETEIEILTEDLELLQTLAPRNFIPALLYESFSHKGGIERLGLKATQWVVLEEREIKIQQEEKDRKIHTTWVE